MLRRLVLIVALLVSVQLAHGGFRAGSPAQRDSSQLNKKTLFKVIVAETAYYTVAIGVLQNTWYHDRKTVPFHFYNDNKAYLQVDKFGHAFGSYVESYLGFTNLVRAGLPRAKAILYGGTLGLVLQAPIEVMDGVHEGWGFSWGDFTANAVGASLVVGQELLFGDQVAKYKFSYWESPYARNANGYLGTTTLQRMLEDYNGHTYWVSVPLACLTPGLHLPRWLSVAVGYGANGMYGEYRNLSNYLGVEIPPATRYRQFLLSVDVDWTRIRTHSVFLNALLKGLTFVKIPFPALEYNSMEGFKGYGLYF